MADKPIQEQFGNTIIDSVRQFAKEDIDDVPTLAGAHFHHISDVAQRTVLAETLYGARWIYKLGLALLVKDVEQMAHVRAQILDYGSICEGLLHHMILHALQQRIMKGQKYKYADTANLTKQLNWVAPFEKTLGYQSFYWHIDVACDEGIIPSLLKSRLHGLRIHRNTVHLKTRTYKAFIGTSMKAFETLHDTIRETQAWKAANP